MLLLVGGEHARELITAEIAAWLGRLLTGTADEMAGWPALAAVTALAKKRGWAKGSLAEWGDALLTHVVFKVSLGWYSLGVSAAHVRCMQIQAH